MLSTGQASDTEAFSVVSFDMHHGDCFDAHRHPVHQLAWAASGVLTVQIGDRSWILPPTLALWIPANVWHSTSATKATLMRSVYIAVDDAVDWTEPTVVSVSPLLRDVIEYLGEPDVPVAARRRAEAFIVDLLQPVTVTTMSVPMPTDDRALAVATALVDEPADQRTLEELGRDVGASVRTLSRLFVAETGMSFAEWRTHARLRAALALLAGGGSISSVARAVGYSTPSAFVAAFHRVTGQTPGAYFS